MFAVCIIGMIIMVVGTYRYTDLINKKRLFMLRHKSLEVERKMINELNLSGKDYIDKCYDCACYKTKLDGVVGLFRLKYDVNILECKCGETK